MSAVQPNPVATAPDVLCPYCEEDNLRDGQCVKCGYFVLTGADKVTFIQRTARRRLCGGCRNLATQRHTYLLEGGRSNPRSSAFGGDDVSWCSDHEEFTCDKCKAPYVQGYRTCSTFSITPTNIRFAHMFLVANDKAIGNEAGAASDLLAALQTVRHLWAGHSEACATIAGRRCDCDWPKIAETCDAAIAKATGAA